ncbi:ATP-binding protein [Microbacterium sp. SSW1-49]|uniref:ATP-binding protein n=1 Tax=Microbacterium croceum TaxID=2851645 RepID=A0ABT0FHL3_9MICO|nr:ATP-binding protein [Microbacterium croceum]MCK2037538.1 ATP-binding protein [Microbacterium croceum]
MTVLAASRIRLEPTPVALRAIGGWLRQATARLDADAAAAMLSRAELAVHEACMNVIEHAGLPEGSEIDLELELTTDRLTIRVSDAGDVFDLDAVADPAPHTLQEGGYGVKIIRSLVDELTYRRSNSMNELELRLNLGSTHA